MFEQYVFLIGLLVFIAAFIFFYFYKRNEVADLNMLVSLTTMISYAVLVAMLGYIKIDCDAYIYPTRWLFYIFSCGFLMYEIATVLKKSKLEIIKMIALNTAVMLTGYLASITESYIKSIFFVISSTVFVLLLKIILEKKSREPKIARSIRVYVCITWSLFPAVWLLAPTGLNLLTPFFAAIFYLALDVTTKIIFGFVMTRHSK